MKTENCKFKQGFTLLEVMVVVAIISIMSISVVIGFNSFGQTLRVEETAGVIEDVIKKLELEVAQNEYQKIELLFEKDFLVVKSDTENSSLDLNYKGIGVDGCQENEVALEIINELEVVYMVKKDSKGNNLEIVPFKTTKTKCIEFLEAKQTGLQYQTYFKTEKSNVIRLFHFNLNRSELNDPVQIVKGTEYKLEIEAPYGKKQYYKNDVEENGPVPLVLENEEGGQKEIMLNE